MLSNNNYTTMTLEELVSAAQKLKSQKTITAVFIGMLFGIAVYSAAHKGFVLPVILLIFAFVIGKRHSQNLKDIQAEINRRETLL